MALKRALLALAASFLVTSCAGEPFSEVLVIVDAQEGVQMQAARLRLFVWSGDEIPTDEPDVPAHMVVIGDDEALSFPFSFGIKPIDNDANRRFRVEAAALTADSDTNPVAVVRATTGFLSGEIRQLRLVLEDACIDVDCSAPLSCRDGHCVNGDIDGSTLPPYGVVGCGDGFLDAGERCDDGNLRDNDGCSATCTPEGSCDAPIDLALAGATLSDGAYVYYGDTADEMDHAVGSCAAAEDGKDVVLRFVPEDDGRIEVSTEGAATVFDTVIYARSECIVPMPEFACNDNVNPGVPTSRMQLDVMDGEPVYLFVDGNGTSAGTFQVTVRMSGGPGTDCSMPIPIEPDADGVFHVTGTTIGAFDDAQGTCAMANGAPEVVYQFTPPADGRIGASTQGMTVFDTVLYARSACDDSGAEVVCNDNDAPGLVSSRLQTDVAEGEPVYLFVDGNNAISLGDYELDFWYVANDATGSGTCDAPTEITVPAEGGTYSDTGSTARAFSDLDAATDCATSGGAPEHVYHFTTPAEGRYVASTEGSTTFDTVLYARDVCEAPPERICNNDVQAGFVTSRIQGYVNEGDELYFVVDGNGPTSRGDYQLDFRYLPYPVEGACDGPIDISLDARTATVTGSTATAFDNGAGDCGGEDALDVVYQVTAPGVGRVGLSTEGGTGFDTALHARSIMTGCGPDALSELGCNDNVAPGFTTSRLEILDAPSMLFVYVDGETPFAQGDYTLDAWYQPFDDVGTCDAPKPISIDLMEELTETDTTLHAFDDTKSAGASCVVDGAPDFAYLVTPARTGLLTISVETADGWGPSLYYGGGVCSAAEASGTCTIPTGNTTTLSFTATMGVAYLIVVDSLTTTSGGDFVATFSLD